MTDAEKVIKGLTLCDVGSDGYCYEKECPYYQNECMYGLKNDILSLLKEQETVVRCKDCKFYDSETGICAKGITHGYAAEWFCGDGKGW